MPKLKTNRGAAKRFRLTASGLKFRRTFRNHILTKKSAKRKRQLRAAGHVNECDMRAMQKILPYAAKKMARRKSSYVIKSVES
jgi:large subunit ribosomal protein L35